MPRYNSIAKVVVLDPSDTNNSKGSFSKSDHITIPVIATRTSANMKVLSASSPKTTTVVNDMFPYYLIFIAYMKKGIIMQILIHYWYRLVTKERIHGVEFMLELSEDHDCITIKDIRTLIKNLS